MNTSEYYVWLVKCMGVGNPRSHKILEAYDDIAEFYNDCKNRCFKSGLKLSESELELLHKIDLKDIEYVYEVYSKYQAQFITIQDELYPQQLRNIDNPPIVLFVVGDISHLESELLLTVVGTRKESLYGKRACEVLCSQLAVSGFSIVSGLANGGDTTAHNTALKCGARTYGFLACGLDVDYPYGKAALKNAIYKNGAVITEFLPQTKALSGNFHIRNRLMSGISVGTLVIESPKKSGTLITAHCAANQGKDVFAVPAGIFWRNSAGIIQLIQDGAKPVKDALDIIEEYAGVYPEKIKVLDNDINLKQIYEVNRQLGLTSENNTQAVTDEEYKKARKEAKKELKVAGKEAVKKGNAFKSENIESIEKRLEDCGMSEDEIALEIVALLNNNSLTTDDIADKTEHSSTEITLTATKLEMGSVIKKVSGNKLELILETEK